MGNYVNNLARTWGMLNELIQALKNSMNLCNRENKHYWYAVVDLCEVCEMNQLIVKLFVIVLTFEENEIFCLVWFFYSVNFRLSKS